MADETAQTAAAAPTAEAPPVLVAKPPRPPLVTNHAKVSASVFAGAVTAFVLSVAKSKAGLDLSGQGANLTMIVMAIVGYVVRDPS